jgi:tripartite-type tricarboxylate transporter receptor subunit TctC
MFDNLTNGLANAKAGKLKALAVTSAQRWPGAPELPTMAESGYPGTTIISTFGLMAPAGTPPAVVAKLAGALQKALQDDKVKKSIIDSGSEPGSLGPKEYGTYIAEESRRWARFLEQNPGIAAVD